jgi:site-specific recombinase XerD
MEAAFRHSISQRNKSRGSSAWHGSYMDPHTNRVLWKSLRTEKKSEAQAWLDRMNARRFMPPEQAAEPSVQAGEAIGAFMRDAENVRKLSKGTLRVYECQLSLLRKFFDGRGIRSLQSITPSVCAEFAQAAFAGHSAHTARNKLVVYRFFFSWAGERYGLRMKNPFGKIAAPKARHKPRDFWTVEECERIIAAAPGEEYGCWFALMAFAGLRREEARLLKMENLNMAEGKISLSGKGGKHAEIPVSGRLKARLEGYMALRGGSPGNLFPKLSKLCKASERIIRNAAAKALPDGTGTAHFHRFRHSFASNLLRAGRNIKAVQMLMRHENVTLTLNTYGHLLPSDLKEAVEL